MSNWRKLYRNKTNKRHLYYGILVLAIISYSIYTQTSSVKIVAAEQGDHNSDFITNNNTISDQVAISQPPSGYHNPMDLVKDNDFMNRLSETDRATLVKYVDRYHGLSDPNQTFQEAYRLFLSQWGSKTSFFSVLANNTSPNLETSLIDTFFGDQKVNQTLTPSEGIPGETVTSYQLEDSFVTVRKAVVGESEVTETKTLSKNQEIVEKKVVAGDYEIIETTTITGRLRVTLEESNSSIIDDLVIPILPKTLSSVEDTVATNTVEETVPIYLRASLPKFDKSLEINLAIVRFRAWAYFESGYHIDFPVNLNMQYPTEVFEGQPFTFSVTLTPQTIPDYKEFEIRLIFNTGARIDVLLPYLTWEKYYWYLPFGIKIPYWLPVIHWRWASVLGSGVGFKYIDEADYVTPLRGEKVCLKTVGFEFDFLSLGEDTDDKDSEKTELLEGGLNALGILCSFFQITYGIDGIYLHGDSITGDVAAITGKNKDIHSVTWSAAGTKEMTFITPSTAEEFMKLSVSNLIFHSAGVTLDQYLKIGFKNFVAFGLIEIPLARWLPPYVISFSTPLLPRFNVPSTWLYTTSGTSVVTADMFNFEMTGEEVQPEKGQGALSTTGPHDKIYRINLQNFKDRTDTIELEVTGLPPGYTATFDRETRQYEIDSIPTTAYLIVSAPERITVPPGSYSFDITATSLTKKKYSWPDPSVTKSLVLQVPEIVDFTLDFEQKSFSPMLVNHTLYTPINFYGENLGNVPDTVTVNATLYTDVENRTWSDSFAITPYGSPVGHFYSGEFGFMFGFNDLFPSPGLYRMEIEAHSSKRPSVVKRETFFFNFTEVFNAAVSISPINPTVFADKVTNFTLTVQNLGNTQDNFTLSSMAWDSYLTFPEKVLFVKPLAIEEVTVTLSIPDGVNLNPGPYPFRILLCSERSGSSIPLTSVDVQVNLLEPNKKPPNIVYLNPFFPSETLRYPRNTPLTLGPSWKAFDEYTDTCAVYINDTVHYSGGWAEGSPIKANMTGIIDFEEGFYNVTVTFNDTSGNVAEVQEWVTIEPQDSTPPSIDPVTPFISLPENIAEEQQLVWNCNEEFLFNVTVYKNDNILPIADLSFEKEAFSPDDWCINLALEPGSLTIGTWNYTLLVRDMGNNIASSNITVTVTSPDLIAPELNPLPSTLATLDQGEFLSLNLIDENPLYYELWINSTLEYNETWQSGIPPTFAVEDLPLRVGENELELCAYDLAGQSYYHSWIFTLQDADAPELLISPPDSVFCEHNLSEIEPLYWILQDRDPSFGQFEIYRDDVLVIEGIWSPMAGKIEVPVRNLTAGIYQFDGLFQDASGNTITSSVVITVLDVLEPYIWPVQPIRFEPLYAANWFELLVTDPHLQSYQIHRNGLLVEEGPITSNYPVIFVELETLEPGYYTYDLTVRDESGNEGQETVHVHVTDYTPPLIRRPDDIVYSEGTTGHEICWEVIEANPKNYSLYHNGELIDSGILTGTNLTLNVDGLGMGIHEYTLVIQDTSGLSHSCRNYVSVVDVTAPFVSHLADCRFVVGDPKAKLTWTVFDLHPASVTLKVNGQMFREEEWTGGEISLSLVGWSTGIHVVQLIITDTSGNIAADEVLVTLIGEETVITHSSRALRNSAGFTLFPTFVILLLVGIAGTVLSRKKK